MYPIKLDAKTFGLLEYDSTGKFPYDISSEREHLKDISKVFVARNNMALSEIYKRQKKHIWHCDDIRIDTISASKSRVTITYNKLFTLVFDEAKESICITFDDDYRSVVGFPKRIVKKNAFPVSLIYSETFYKKFYDLYTHCQRYKASHTPDRKEKLTVLRWLKEKEQHMQQFYFSYLIDVDMSEAQSFDIRIHLYYPDIKGHEVNGFTAFRKIITTDIEHYQHDFWELLKDHCQYSVGIMRNTDNALRYTQEASRLEEFVNNWLNNK